MKEIKEEYFKSFPISVKGFFLNQYDSIDSGKNYLIPIYQRRFVWDSKLVSKLLQDIKEVSDKKNFNNVSPYFIGGVVLCKELTNEEPPYLSLEVIDGQQRLTTISIIIAAIYNQLKFHLERNFTEQRNWVDNQIQVIEKLLFIIKQVPGTFKIETGLTIERSDELHEVYSDILLSFKDNTFSTQFATLSSSARYKDISQLYCRRLITAAQLIDQTLTSYDDYSLLEFCSQLLDSTFLVVTKTLDVETGFLVFEKLNDSGASLEPEDLLKSFLFSESPEHEFTNLNKAWKTLIDTIENINTGKAKLTPRDFLDQYLTINGLESGEMDKRKIFKVIKNHLKDNNLKPSVLVDDLIKIANKYRVLKQDHLIKTFINPLNFKLGYLILLAYYSKLGDAEFEIKKRSILVLVIRLAFVYLLSGNSKKVREVVNSICSDIVNYTQHENYKIIDQINEKIKGMESSFLGYLQTANLFTKKSSSTLLLNIINFHLGDEEKWQNYQVISLMSPKYNEICNYEGITKENHPLYKFRFGNYTLVNKHLKFDDKMCVEQKKILLENENTSELSKKFLELLSRTSTWGKNSITLFGDELSEKASEIFIHGKFDERIFNL